MLGFRFSSSKRKKKCTDDVIDWYPYLNTLVSENENVMLLSLRLVSTVFLHWPVYANLRRNIGQEAHITFNSPSKCWRRLCCGSLNCSLLQCRRLFIIKARPTSEGGVFVCFTPGPMSPRLSSSSSSFYYQRSNITRAGTRSSARNLERFPYISRREPDESFFFRRRRPLHCKWAAGQCNRQRSWA